MIKNKAGFSLIEIMIGILIFTMVFIGGFIALSSVNIGKIKLIQKTDISKEAYYFAEKLFEEIKSGGTTDYEEYFNRLVIGLTTSSGSYSLNTGFGNFGRGGIPGSTNYGDSFYYCRSGNGISMGTGGCYNNTFNTHGSIILGQPQRYGQYTFQFIDYNSNMNNDLGDENGDTNIRGDDDDENLGEGPIVFNSGENVREIYLISGDGKKRTFLRWRWEVDPNRPNSTYECNSITFGSGCIGNIEILKLDGKDWGINHNKSGTGFNDGVIDTWIIDPKFTGGTEVIAGSNNTNYRQKLFTNNISVSDFQVYIYPNVNRKHFWKSNNPDKNINPYIRLNITLTPSWKKKAGIRGTIPELKISTTINLSDYFDYF